MKTVEAHTGMIKFGFGIVLRQSGCAYFTRLTLRNRLQVFDWHALPGLCASASKEKHPPCFDKTQPQTHIVQKDAWQTGV